MIAITQDGCLERPQDPWHITRSLSLINESAPARDSGTSHNRCWPGKRLLPDVLGKEIFQASGIGRTDETGALRTRVGQLEQQVLDLSQELEERTDDLNASRAANHDLMTLANRKPAIPGYCTTPAAHQRRQHAGT